MKRWLRRLKRAYKYAKLYYRNSVREFNTAMAILRQLTDPPTRTRRSTRPRTRQRRTTTTVRVDAFTRANGTHVKAHTRKVSKVTHNGRTTR